MPSPASLVEVARRAKVSISTVSRTISQTGRIGAQTQEKVRRVMRELGYQPNRVARRLRATGGKCNLIGLVIPNIQNPFFAELARGVEDCAIRHNFAVLLCNYDEDPAKEQFYLDVLRAEFVDGIILPPLHETDPAVIRAAKSGLPIVCVDRRLSTLALDTVEIDNQRAACEAVAYLLQRGHRRIGVIAGPANSSTGRERLQGYRNAYAQAGLAVPADCVRTGDYKQESGRALATALLNLRRPPTALFACNNLMGIGALEAINALGRRIPQDVGFLCFDDLPLAAVFNPPLTVVRQPAYAVGCEATQLLLQRLESPAHPPATVRLAAELIVRSSC